MKNWIQKLGIAVGAGVAGGTKAAVVPVPDEYRSYVIAAGFLTTFVSALLHPAPGAPPPVERREPAGV